MNSLGCLYSTFDPLLGADPFLGAIPNVKVMKGHPDYFRVRIGDYRLGLKRIDGGVKIIRFLSRGDIYRKFP
jgi:mRNA interferase RelE/StbE